MMKTNRGILRSVILFICTLALLVVLPASAQDEATINRAENFYQQGFSAYTMKDWLDAASNFEQSFRLIPHSMTAYMLSVTYLNRESPTKALQWAETATHSKPVLEEPYETSVGKIVDWARRSINDPYYTLSGKADEAGRPSRPQARPPRAALPQKNTLGLARSGVTAPPPVPGNFTQPPIPAQPLTPLTLTGTWRCNDGGTYYIRQIGSVLWWYGRSPDGGRTWSNVFHGRIDRNRIKGQWADVPRGHALSSGEMTLQIVDTNKLSARYKSGGFGGNEWTR